MAAIIADERRGAGCPAGGGEGRRVEVVLVVDGREDSINYSRPSRSGRPA